MQDITMQALARVTDWLAERWRGFGRRVDTPADRVLARLHVEFVDHGLVRRVWTNLAPVAPGVFRANHPSRRQLARYKAMGIVTILSLRGTGRNAPQLLEAGDCAALGLTLVATGLQARAPSSRAALLRLFALFRSVDRPVLMHCKSGADRAGLASALYLMGIEGRSPAEARRQLSLRFLHVRQSKTGILDHMLDLFEQRQAETGIGIEDWIATEYDPVALEAGFRAQRRGRRP